MTITERSHYSAPASVLAGIAIATTLMACSPPESAPAARSGPYAAEYPAMAYAATEPAGRLGGLAAEIASGATAPAWNPEHGYLDAVLTELDISATSQVLVFSRTSLQTREVHPTTPRAIYFSDDSYVAWIPGAASFEVASFDPALGPVFYSIVQDTAHETTPEREFETCLRCHDSYSMTGGGVPRFLLGSGYIGTEGELVSHEAWILTRQATPLRSRWGGWYVTGQHGSQVHLGNIVVQQPEDLQDLDSLRVGNLDDLNGILDTSRYLTPYSDIVALLVLEHQVEVQNLISRLHFEAAGDNPAPLDEHVNALAEAMLMVNEIELTDRISGTSGFAERFEALGPFDSTGRSLRQLDLRSRVFRYPLSYLIYSDAIAALPAKAKTALFARLREILEAAPGQDAYERLGSDDRAAIVEILRDTLPEYLSP